MHCWRWGRGEGGIEGLQDLPERNTAEDERDVEAPEGERSVEVM